MQVTCIWRVTQISPLWGANEILSQCVLLTWTQHSHARTPKPQTHKNGKTLPKWVSEKCQTLPLIQAKFITKQWLLFYVQTDYNITGIYHLLHFDYDSWMMIAEMSRTVRDFTVHLHIQQKRENWDTAIIPKEAMSDAVKTFTISLLVFNEFEENLKGKGSG